MKMINILFHANSEAGLPGIQPTLIEGGDHAVSPAAPISATEDGELLDAYSQAVVKATERAKELMFDEA